MENKFNNSWTEAEKTDFIGSVNKGYIYPSANRNLGLESSSGIEYLKTLEFLHDKNLKNGFIEIGSAWGASFHFWGSLILGTKISVDIPYGMNVKGGGVDPWPPELTHDVFERRLQKWEDNFSDIYSVVGYSYADKTIEAVEKILDGKKVSFLYIDAEHTYDGVKKDYEMYNKFVEKGGYIGFHDIQIELPKNMAGFWREISAEFGDKAHVMEGKKEKIGIIQV